MGIFILCDFFLLTMAFAQITYIKVCHSLIFL